MNINDLIPYENNPRHNERAIRAVAESIKEIGFKNPIIINNDNVIIAGHTRLQASKMLGLEEVPVIRADDLTEEQQNAFRLVDNKTNEIADWDETLLKLEILNLDGEFDFTLFGFDEDRAVEEEEKKKDQAKLIKEMELKTFEHYDYLVFVFDNQMDWMHACERFQIDRVDGGYGTNKKVGVGRVLKGARLLKEIKALHDSFLFINKGKKAKDFGGRIFISKAVILLVEHKKNRDADILSNYVYDKKIGVSDGRIEEIFNEISKEHPEIPEYVYDVHTYQGKRNGKTKRDFFEEEQEALVNNQQSLFDIEF